VRPNLILGDESKATLTYTGTPPAQLDTQTAGAFVNDFAYDGSHNLTEVEIGTGAQTAVWTYLYDCWEP